jgi:exonuclease III
MSNPRATGCWPSKAEPLLLVNWNIRHGGGRRRDAIADAIAQTGADVAVLTEYRNAPDLLARLAAHGFTHQLTSGPPPRANGVAIVAKSRLVAAPACTVLPRAPTGRWLEARLHRLNIHLLAVYLPWQAKTADGSAKDAFWYAVHSAAEVLRKRRALIVGDLNTGAQAIDEERKTFLCADAFVALERDLKWRDAYRLVNGDQREYTWWSLRKGGGPGHGYRIDHIFVSPPLSSSVSRCWYSSAEYDARLSDHRPQLLMLQPHASQSEGPTRQERRRAVPARRA